MRKKLEKIILEQKNILKKSFSKDREVWQDLYNFGKAYTKEFETLFSHKKKRTSQ